MPDVLQSIAIRKAAQDGLLDALRVPDSPLDVLAQALLGMSIEKPWRLHDAYRLATKAGPYLDLSLEDFEATIEYLAGGGGGVGPSGAYGKIILEDDKFRVSSRSVRPRLLHEHRYHQRRFCRSRLSTGRTASSERWRRAFWHRCGRTKPSPLVVCAVVLDRLHQTTAVVAPGTGRAHPDTALDGSEDALTAQLAREERRLRDDRFVKPGVSAVWEACRPHAPQRI